MPEGGYKTMRGRRVAATIAAKAELPREVYAFQAPHCTYEDCVRPDHAATGSRSDWMTSLSGRGRLDTPARRATVAKYLLRTKVGIEQRTEIIQSAEPARILAERHGCSISLIHHIRSSAQAPAYRQRIRAPSVFEWRP